MVPEDGLPARLRGARRRERTQYQPRTKKRCKGAPEAEKHAPCGSAARCRAGRAQGPNWAYGSNILPRIHAPAGADLPTACNHT